MRRLNARLQLMWKAVNNTVCLKILDYITSKGRITRQYNPKKFIQPYSSGNTYKFSSFARTIGIGVV